MGFPSIAARRAPNELRYAGRPGHVESWFLRANDPTSPRALWLKITILAPLAGPAVAETWLIWFDGAETFARRETHPIGEARFETDAAGSRVEAGAFRFALARPGSAKGALGSGEASFDLRFAPDGGAVGAPLSCYPSRLLEDGPFPRSKFLTPLPFLSLDGEVVVRGRRVSVDGWTAAQGHNWGPEHHFDYAWSQCLFPAEGGEPAGFVEGGSSRLRIAGRTTPLLSVLVVRRGARDDRVGARADLHRQEPPVARDRYTHRMRSREASARLRVDASGRPPAWLGYLNPDGAMAYCSNTKLASVLLEVFPRDEPPFTYRSAHGGALELLRREVEPGIEVT